jgi:hypothetical protein
MASDLHALTVEAAPTGLQLPAAVVETVRAYRIDAILFDLWCREHGLP